MVKTRVESQQGEWYHRRIPKGIPARNGVRCPRQHRLMAGKTPPQAPIPLPKSKRGMRGFWTEVVRELKKVSWPTAKETSRLTGVVLAVCTFLVLALMVMNFTADTLFKILSNQN